MDARNYGNKVRRLELKEGDAEAMHKYFIKMKVDSEAFFYAMDLDEKNRLKNVFWADARSREAFKEFGDVVTFDTTYLVNKWNMPFAPFVGVNHHGQSVLFGCGLILQEDTDSFIWLFETWLACMSGCSPNAIIIDQCCAMQNAISIVFPNARHCWCLWHLLKKVPEKLKNYNDYEPIKWDALSAAYDSLTKEEFEKNWANLINEVCEEECLNNRPMSINRVDRIISSKEKKIVVGDPTKRRRQGRPPVNRKQPRIENIIRKIKQSSKNGKVSRGNAKNITVSLDNMYMELPNVHTMEVNEVIMQESTSQMIGSRGGMWSYDLDKPSTNL